MSAIGEIIPQGRIATPFQCLSVQRFLRFCVICVIGVICVIFFIGPVVVEWRVIGGDGSQTPRACLAITRGVLQYLAYRLFVLAVKMENMADMDGSNVDIMVLLPLIWACIGRQRSPTWKSSLTVTLTPPSSALSAGWLP